MPQYLIHNGFSGWSYGTPQDPTLISAEDAAKIIAHANLSKDDVSTMCPPAQYANTNDKLFKATLNNRFIYFGNVNDCTDVNPEKTSTPLKIDWPHPN